MKQSLSFLAVVLIGLVFVEARGEVAKSINGGDRLVRLSVRNTTQLRVFAAWVSYQGQMKHYGTLAPGQFMVFETYPGHLWKFGAGNRLLGEHRATQLAEQSYAVVNTPAQGRGAPPRARPVPAPQPAQTPAATVPSGSKITADEAGQLVKLHNTVRREVGVGAVTWSPELARFAQQWADQLAREGKFEHRPQGRQNYGENLAANSSVLAGAKMWVEEKRLFTPGAAFDMSLIKAAHYSQMVWRGTTRIGAGKAIVTSGPLKGLTVLVCNYSPPGNVIGQKPY